MKLFRDSTRYTGAIYTDDGRRSFLIIVVAMGILLPVFAVDYLEPVVTYFPIAAILAIYMVRSGRPKTIPTWIIWNSFSFYLMVYAAYSFGTMLPLGLLILFMGGMLVYDLVGVKGGQMQSMAAKMIHWGIPIFILVPHTKEFDFGRFRSLVDEEGLEGLHGSDQGVSMLGIGDGFIPGALAVSAAAISTTIVLGPAAITIPQLGAAFGGIGGLAILMWAELPRAIAALIVSVPGALLGLSIGYAIDPLIIEFLLAVW